MSTLSQFAAEQRAIIRARQLADEATRAARAEQWERERAAPVAFLRATPRPRKAAPRAPKEPDTLEAIARDLRRLAGRVEAMMEKEDER